MTQPQSLIEWALYYAQEMGWPVFPVHAKGKAPLTIKGFKEATKDEKIIRAWWARWPNANIGVPAGPSSGLAILDVDQPLGPTSLQAYIDLNGPIPDTLESITGGGGKQYFFRFLEGFKNSAGNLGRNLDTRGEGGYVVVPPSIHPSLKAYEWELSSGPGTALADLPPWLRPGSSPIIPTRIEGGNLGGIFDAQVVMMKATGDPVEPGGRNVAAASLAGQYVAEGDSVQVVQAKLRAWNQTNPVPLPDKELEHTVASIVVTHQKKHPGAVIKIAEVCDVHPDIPEIEPPKPHKFPEHLLKAPGFVGEIVEYVLQTSYKPQPILALANALAFFGAVVGRKVQTPSRLRTNLYCLGIGESGSGKDHSRKAIKAICAQAGLADQLLGGEDISSDSAILGAVHEHPSLLFQFDEVGHMIASNNSRYAQSHQRAIAPLLTKLFSSANTIYLGKEYAGRKDKRKDIEQPNVCIYGTTVPSRLYEGLTPGEITDGFLGRMLVFQSDQVDPDPQEAIWKEPPENIVTMVQTWFSRTDLPQASGNVASVTKHIPLTVEYEPEAKKRLKQFEWRCRSLKVKEREQTGLDVLWSRANEHAAKVSLIAACGTDYPTPRVSGDVMAWAIDLVEYLTSALIDAVGDSVAGSDFERDLLYVQRYVRESGSRGITHTQLNRKTRRLTPKVRTDILSALVSDGTIVRREKKAQRGPASIVYEFVRNNGKNNGTPTEPGDSA